MTPRESWALDRARTALVYLERGNVVEAHRHLRGVGAAFDRQNPVPEAYTDTPTTEAK